MSEPGLLQPAWPVPSGVRALSTTRLGGVSTGPYASFNLGRHVGDEPAAVSANRARLRQSAGLPDEPVWLDQQHGIEVLNLDHDHLQSTVRRADAAVASGPGLV
ncbi:MAG: laccase domain-containing protein, partial [Gammaproteobacteria bacterium]